MTGQTRDHQTDTADGPHPEDADQDGAHQNGADGMTLDIAFEDPRWEDFGLQPLAETAVAAVLSALGLEAEEAEATLLACDDARIAELNAEFRDKPTPTNVLSWPAEERAAEVPGTAPALPAPDIFGTLELGDMAIAWETCEREAAEQGKPMADHVTHLIVHATLHLLGYDHVHDDDAALMEGREVAILATLGIANPYE